MTNSAVCFLERYSLSNQVVVEDIRFIKVHNGVIYQSSQWCLKENFRGKKKWGWTTSSLPLNSWHPTNHIEHKIRLLYKIHLLRELVLTWKIFLRIIGYEKISHFIILTIQMKWEILLEVIVNFFNMKLNDPLENILRAAIAACLVYNQHKKISNSPNKMRAISKSSNFCFSQLFGSNNLLSNLYLLSHIIHPCPTFSLLFLTFFLINFSTYYYTFSNFPPSPHFTFSSSHYYIP